MRKLFILILLLITLPGSAQNRSRVWIFGQGLSMDFNTDPPTFGTVPWQPTTPGYQHDNNQSSSLCDDNGNLLIYFLNGRYYDAQHNVLSGGRVHHYISSLSVVYSFKSSSFFNDFNSDTLYHYYTFSTQPSSRPSSTDQLHIRLNKIYRQNGNWKIDSLDNWIPNVIVGGVWSNSKIIPYVNQTNHRNFIIFGDDSLEFLEITGHGFQSLSYYPSNLFTLGFMPDYLTFYHPLVDQFYVMNLINSNQSSLVIYKDLGNQYFYQIGTTLPLVSPNDSMNTGYRVCFPILTATTYEGRYLYTFSKVAGNPHLRLFRYDLFAKDSTEFKKTAVEVPLNKVLTNSFNGTWPSDMQVGPDQNLYFILRHISQQTQLGFGNDPTNKVMGRIEHAEDSIPGNIVVNMNYHTFPDWSLYHSFPTFNSSQSMPPPFELLSSCRDSVYFDLTYKNVTDSVWWDFGEPQLGAGNHSSSKTPVVQYPNYGRYYAQVELYWNGNLLNTMGDSITIDPVPEVSLPGDTLICSSQSVLLKAGQGFAATYLWSTGSQDSILNINQSGTYWVVVSTACGTASDTIQITVLDPPTASLRDTGICQEWELTLKVYADSATYLWSTGETGPRIAPTESGLYSVDITNPCGAITDQANVDIHKCECHVWVPNAFSPNGDGKNDRFEIGADCQGLEYSIEFFNRWGEKLYHQNQGEPFWNGTFHGQPVPEGVYVYRIHYSGLQHNRNIEKEEMGTVSVVR